MFDWIKKNYILIICGLIVLVFGVPFIIHCVYNINVKNEFMKARWSAGELLGYYGTALSFLGTTFLSVLALWQNNVIKTNEENHMLLLEKVEREKNYPKFYCKHKVSYGYHCNLNLHVVISII